MEAHNRPRHEYGKKTAVIGLYWRWLIGPEAASPTKAVFEVPDGAGLGKGKGNTSAVSHRAIE